MQTQMERFVDQLRQANTLDDFQSIIVGTRDELDVEHIIYHSVNSTGQQYAALTYSPDWVHRYIGEDYARIDPVVQGCYQRFNPVDWKRLDWSGRAQRAFLGEAQDAGVGNQGFSVPIRGPRGQFAMFTVSDRASDGAWEKFTQHHLGRLILIAHFLNQRALELEHGTDFLRRNILSPREMDALTMLALGMNRSQAADGLSISEHTFRDYVESARGKLEATNTTHAVAKAVALGYVTI
jgi:DNA-binding CsgD family transcriptional regulator